MGDTAHTRSGKRIFGTVVLVGIIVGTILGLVIGTNPEIQHISIFDVVRFHATPLGMALYGAIATTGVFTAILGVVMLLSQFDQRAV